MAERAARPRLPAAPELQLLLKVLMAFRVITVTLFLGVLAVVQIKGRQVHFFAPLSTIYLLIVSVYLITIFFSAIFNQVRSLGRFAQVQVGTDLAVTTVIVFLTGGIDSPFAFLYLFSIIWGSLAFSGGGYWTASVSSILYGAVVDLQYYRILLPPHGQRMADGVDPWDAMGRTVLNIAAFYAVAFLGHQMARRYRSARLELTAKTVDLERLRSLSDVVFESIPSGIMVLGPEGEVRSINSAARAILGLGADQVVGLSLASVLPGSSLDSLNRQASATGLKRWEGPLTGREGRARTLGLSISPLQEPEKGTVMIFQDLTELREMEGKLKVSEKLSAVGRMAASIAHEVRNPLASMSGSIQILRDSLDLRKDDRRLMQIVLDETERLNGLVGDFLSYARPQSPRFEDVDLCQLVGDTVDLVRTAPRGEGVSVATDLPEGPAILSVDAAQIRQILMNLLANAIEAVGERGRVVVGLTREQRGGKASSVLWVHDDGPGIPPDILPKIFEPFTTTKEKGTGLGLAIVYQLVQIHKAAIDVSTGPGAGTRFSITFPEWRRS